MFSTNILVIAPDVYKRITITLAIIVFLSKLANLNYKICHKFVIILLGIKPTKC